MNQTIDKHWRPAKKSSSALKLLGYSQEQLNRIGRVFIERYLNKDLEDASTKFTAMVKSSESGHNVKQKPNSAKSFLEDRRKDLENKSSDGVNKAIEIKKKTDSDELKEKIDAMIARRWR